MRKLIIMLMFSMFMTASTLAKPNVWGLRTEKITQNEVLYHFGTRTFSKELYIQNH